MRIQNKYLRNRHFREKNWERIRNTQHPFETSCPYNYLFGEYNSIPRYSYEAQVKRHFEWITTQARGLESGADVFLNAPAWYRRMLNVKRKAKERSVMFKINQGYYEMEVPHFKKDSTWNYL